VASRPASASRVLAQRAAPYLVTASIVLWILHKYPARQIAAEMSLGHAGSMLPAALALPFAVWLQYAACDRVIMLGAIGRIPYRDVVRAKAASAILMTLGYFFGGGGYAVWIARKTGVGAARATGVVLYVMASDLVAVCSVASVSAWLGGIDVPHVLRTVATAIVAVQVTLILIAPYGVAARLPVVFEAWRKVPRAWSLAQIAVRAVNIVTITGFTWAGARGFGMDVPLRVMGLYMPIILLVGSLPFSVAGLGAAQAAWLLLLPWASGPRILAFQMLWQLFTGAGILLRGLPFLRRVVAEIAKGPETAGR
jgi:hypothetical protein